MPRKRKSTGRFDKPLMEHLRRSMISCNHNVDLALGLKFYEGYGGFRELTGMYFTLRELLRHNPTWEPQLRATYQKIVNTHTNIELKMIEMVERSFAGEVESKVTNYDKKCS